MIPPAGTPPVLSIDKGKDGIAVVTDNHSCEDVTDERGMQAAPKETPRAFKSTTVDIMPSSHMTTTSNADMKFSDAYTGQESLKNADYA